MLEVGNCDRFHGRGPELDQLVNLWTDVVRTRRPRLCVLVAESGFGKTRLAQEFYKKLSRDFDPDCYWPDDMRSAGRSLAVNPTMSQDNGGRVAPWLWWGMRWSQPTARNVDSPALCAIDQYLVALEPHLRLIKARKLKLRSLLEVGDPIIDVVLSAASLGFVSSLRSIIQAGERTCEFIRESKLLSRGPGAQLEALHSERKSVVREALNGILQAGMPVVLMLDDAQWADCESAEFVGELLRATDQSSGALLVLATAWEREWSEAGAQKCSLREATETFDQERLTELQIGPLAQVGELLNDRLPGLRAEQRRSLLSRVQGNPLFLEEWIRLLLSRPESFVDMSPDKPLSAFGEKSVLEGPRSLKDALEQRFFAFDLSLREALGWGSVQGVRFLKRLVRDSRRLEGGEGTDEALKLSESPGALIRSRENGEVAEFRLVQVHALVREWFKSLRDPEKVDGTLRAVLEKWIVDDDIDRLSGRSQLDVCRLGMKLFVRGREPWAAYASRAVIVLVQMHRWSEAVRLAKLWADSMPDDGWSFTGVPLRTQLSVHSVLRNARIPELSLATAETIVSKVRESGDRDLLPPVLDAKGSAAVGQGCLDLALACYREALQMREEALESHGYSADTIEAVCESLDRVASVLHTKQELAQAMRAYRRSARYRALAWREFGRAPEQARMRARALRDLGGLCVVLGNHRRGLGFLLKARWFAEQSVQAAPGSFEACREFAIVLQRTGDTLKGQGQIDAASREFKASLAFMRRAVRRCGGAPALMRDLANSLERCALTQDVRAARRARGRLLEECLQIRLRCVAASDGAAVFLRDLAITCIRLAEACVPGQDWRALGLEVICDAISRFGPQGEFLHVRDELAALG